jgi:hypothetical protein
LHILCRKEFIQSRSGERVAEGVTSEATNKIPKESHTLRDLITHRQEGNKELRGRVFLGPWHSGTRQVAEVILKNYGYHSGDVNDLAADHVSNWDEMRAAFLQKTIDVAFFCGAINSDVIRQIADDETCVLVGLNGSRDAILQQNSQLVKAAINPDCYLTGGFCDGEFETVATRSVLACSRKISEQDAYALAKASRAALRGELSIDWKMKLPSEQSSIDQSFTYAFHRGAELLRDGAEPRSLWNEFLTFMFSTVGVWGIIEVLRWSVSRGAPQVVENGASPKPAATASTPAASTPAEEAGWEKVQPGDVAEESDAYRRKLSEQIERDIAVVSDMSGMTVAAHARWSERIEKHAEALKVASTSALLDDVSSKILKGKLAHLRLVVEECRSRGEEPVSDATGMASQDARKNGNSTSQKGFGPKKKNRASSH